MEHVEKLLLAQKSPVPPPPLVKFREEDEVSERLKIAEDSKAADEEQGSHGQVFQLIDLNYLKILLYLININFKNLISS